VSGENSKRPKRRGDDNASEANTTLVSKVNGNVSFPILLSFPALIQSPKRPESHVDQGGVPSRYQDSINYLDVTLKTTYEYNVGELQHCAQKNIVISLAMAIGKGIYEML
jgi:hypothetical protein